MLDRNEAQDAALEVLLREFGDADHLARLDVIWHGEPIRARRDVWRAAIGRVLPTEHKGARLAGGSAIWLWRTMRSVEAAGDGRRAGRGRRDQFSAADRGVDIAAVIDARIRRATGAIAPAAWRSWSDRVPQMADRQRQQFVTELAAAMDARRAQIGEHAPRTAPAWAINALGPVPHDPLDLLQWTERASAVGAYRELYRIESQTDPVGPEPVNSPGARSARMAAYSAQQRQAPSGLDRLPDSSMYLRRAQ